MYLISYDIENDQLRLKISKALIRWGLHRVQYSVFMGAVSKINLSKLSIELQGFSRQKSWSPTDSILIVPIAPKQQKAIQSVGAWPDRWEEMTGEINTLML